MEVSTQFVGIAIGDTFSSFQHLSEKKKSAEDASFVQLYLCDSHTLEAAKKRMPNIAAKANTNLKYYAIQYSCIFNGQNHKTESKGIRSPPQ